MGKDEVTSKELKAVCKYLTDEEKKALCEKLMAGMTCSAMTSSLLLPGSAPARPPAAGATCQFEEFGESECEISHCEAFHTQSGFMN